MPKELQWWSARRVAALSVAVVVVIAASVGVTIWRYESALSRSAVELDAHIDATRMEALVAIFWHEREAMREDLLTPSPDVLLEIRAAEGQFAATAAPLARSGQPAEARLRAEATTANGKFGALYIRLLRTAGTKLSRDTGANTRLDAAETAVLGPLGQLGLALDQRADAAQAAAAQASGQALGTGLAAAILAVLAGIAFALFALRLLRSAFDRSTRPAERPPSTAPLNLGSPRRGHRRAAAGSQDRGRRDNGAVLGGCADVRDNRGAGDDRRLDRRQRACGREGR
jgi:hypothetical protein